MQQRVFITGSTGLVGGHLLVQLYLQGAKIKSLVRKTSNFEQLRLISDFYSIPFQELHRSVEWVYGDTLDFMGLKEVFDGIDTVYHCAAIVSFNNRDRATLLRTNVQGTANVVDAALESGVKRLCFISSIAALGKAIEHDFIDENTPRDVGKQVSAYSESKFFSELEVWRGAAEGLEVVILNPGVIIGPGLPDKGSMLLFHVGSKGLPFYVDSQTGYVDVRDICRAAIELVDKQQFGKRFVMVAKNINNKQLFSMIAQEFGKKGPTIHLGMGILRIAALISTMASWVTQKSPQLTSDTLRSISQPEFYSSQLIRDTLGFMFTPFEDTIHDTALFLKQVKKEQQKTRR